MKGEHAFGQLIIKNELFQSWDPSSPVDVYFKSKSLRLVFRNPNVMAKNFFKLEIWIENEQNLAVFRFVPRNCKYFTLFCIDISEIFCLLYRRESSDQASNYDCVPEDESSNSES